MKCSDCIHSYFNEVPSCEMSFTDISTEDKFKIAFTVSGKNTDCKYYESINKTIPKGE